MCVDWFRRGQCLWRPEETIRFPVRGVTDGFEPLDLGNENQALVIWKNSKHSGPITLDQPLEEQQALWTNPS